MKKVQELITKLITPSLSLLLEFEFNFTLHDLTKSHHAIIREFLSFKKLKIVKNRLWASTHNICSGGHIFVMMIYSE